MNFRLQRAGVRCKSGAETMFQDHPGIVLRTAEKLSSFDRLTSVTMSW